MNHASLKILQAVAKDGDVAVQDAVGLAPRSHGDHRDQYPLAMLIEDDYLGLSVSHAPPEGAERMREFSLAITLHMESLPKSADGSVEYNGVRSAGDIGREWNRVFLKAKGALYLAERAEKRTERLFHSDRSGQCLSCSLVRVMNQGRPNQSLQHKQETVRR